MELNKIYGQILADNIKEIGIKCFYQDGNLYLNVDECEPNKAWLYAMLEGLPEIELPLERLQLVVYAQDSMKFVTIINPSEFDISAMDNAIANGLNFSKPPIKLVPLPLDHPWYSNKDYFAQKRSQRKK